MTGERHLRQRCEQPTVGAVVIRQQLTISLQLPQDAHQRSELFRVVEIGRLVADLLRHLRQDRAAHSISSRPEVNQYQQRVVLGGQLRCQRTAHVIDRGRGAGDQGHRRGDDLLAAALLPGSLHRQRVLANRDADAERQA